VFSAIFRSGQVLETVRGAGIFQPAVDVAIEKLNSGAWVRYSCVSALKNSPNGVYPGSSI
jgi:monolysocardiolipin acyltransferase